MTAAFVTSPSSRSASTVATPAAQASGCPQAVSPLANSCSSSHGRSFSLTTTAPSGTAAPLMPLASVMMSGATSQWSQPNQRPVRPNPVMTSSRMSRMPCRSQTSRMDAR